MKYEVELKKQVIEADDIYDARYRVLREATITPLPAPEWLPIEEIGQFEERTTLWGVIDGQVYPGKKGISEVDGHSIFLSLTDMSFEWDQEHQPTLVMLKVDDVKPEPPVQSFYEQVKEIYDGEGSWYDKWLKLFHSDFYYDLPAGRHTTLSWKVQKENKLYQEPLHLNPLSCQMLLKEALRLTKKVNE